MRVLNRTLIALSLLAAPAAFAQAAPVAGASVDGFELVEDRTVIFELLGDGKVKILKVEEKNPHAAMPRNPGQVAVTMNYAREIGTVIEFNSGLDYAVDYKATLVGPPEGGNQTAEAAVCAVNDQSVGSEQWPQPFPKILLSGFRRNDRPKPCTAG
ncbi:MAG: hypothetical protein Q8R02_13825 [Hyphomonadaceae bacterium]|nr:hypothetical protein [Hyphomonadaceae bacterium]